LIIRWYEKELRNLNSGPIVLCNRCQTAIAEVFQDSDDFCLCCWQERTYPSIGSAHMEQELRSVLTVTRKLSNKMEEETGVKTSITEEDMKQYLNDVIKEIHY
jgi:hypothetical protein